MSQALWYSVTVLSHFACDKTGLFDGIVTSFVTRELTGLLAILPMVGGKGFTETGESGYAESNLTPFWGITILVVIAITTFALS